MAALGSDKSRSREVRLGLVMYGGVSLAVYINGVAHELFRAVRGRGVYGLLKALTDSDVIVDVLSGASAGGINGILLAYALCNECEFSRTANLWREHGDIGELLRGTRDAPESYMSLLDSEGKYEPWLREAFDALADAKIAPTADEAKSDFKELDLFVVGTDFHGRRWATTDQRGQEIQVKDHRTVFWLKHRRGRKEPLSRDSNAVDETRAPTATPSSTHAALARLARITSCFPVAFAPVVVRSDDVVDKRLRRWGDVPDIGVDPVYIDGGVLDNKPFSTTLDAIYSRLADRPVSRWLLYVEPDPERFAKEPAHRDAPAVLETALGALTSIPGYQSIGGDLQSLRQHNDQVERLAAVRKNVSTRAEVLAEDNGYLRLRLMGLCDHAFASLFRQEIGQSSSGPAADSARHVLRAYVDKFGAGPSARSFLEEVDADFRLRRLYDLLYNHKSALRARPGLLEAVNRQIQVLEIVRAALERAVDPVANAYLTAAALEVASLDESWAKGVWSSVLQDLRARLDDTHPETYDVFVAGGDLASVLPQSEIDAFARKLAAPARTPSARLAILAQADDFEKRLFAESDAWAAYSTFESADRVVYPLELVSQLSGHDIARVVRVSPFDSQKGIGNREKKVMGQGFGHFAAFLKRSWRSNDILWGRIDGACELVEVLLNGADGNLDRLSGLFASDDTGVRARLAAHVAKIELDLTVVPLPAAQRKQLFRWLGDVCSNDSSRRETAIRRLQDEDDPSGPRQLLVHAAQLEALNDGIGAVLSDAAFEQLSWNEYPRPGADDKAVSAGSTETEARAKQLQWRPSGPFVPGAGPVDAAVIAATTAVVARRAGKTLSRDPAVLERFFLDDYRVGTETTGKTGLAPENLWKSSVRGNGLCS